MHINTPKTDNDNCRVYYQHGRHLVCFQEDTPGAFTLYACTSDGEPGWRLKPEKIVAQNLPDEDDSTATAFRKWWQEREG